MVRDSVLDDPCSTTLNGADGEVSSWCNMDSNLLSTSNEKEQADPLLDAMTQLKYSKQQRCAIVSELQRAGLWDAATAADAPMVVAPGDTSSTSNSSSTSHNYPSQLLWTLMTDWLDSSDAEQISSVLHRDFGLAVLHAHQVRAALQQMQKPKRHGNNFNNTHDIHMEPKSLNQAERSVGTNQAVVVEVVEKQIIRNASSTTRGHYRELIVSPVARQRAAVTADRSSSSRPGERTSGSFTYGLTRRSLRDEFPLVNTELDAFFTYMTVPQAGAQVPLRPATAEVYRQHVLLFLGWYWNVHLPEMMASSEHQVVDQQRLSIHQIFPNAKQESIQPVLLFLQWLRMTRHCSVSYEANLLRGLNKWLQFRFHNDNNNNNQDNDLRRELRRWHCDANRRQAVAPRVADESRKWLAWPDFLHVVRLVRDDLRVALQRYDDDHPQKEPHSVVVQRRNHTAATTINNNRTTATTVTQRQQLFLERQQRAVATLFQKYLVLTFFAYIPDRQRTMRELELGRSFLKNSATNQYMVKHSPEDYKTGKTYGDRPPLLLPMALTADIDDFLHRWRPFLRPTKQPIQNYTDSIITKQQNQEQQQNVYLFCQARTGQPLTSNSVYLMVSATCYQYSGKRTNPHLLRDMIVTHVRETNASEQQLEALALFMGHSVLVQKKSYDRRTLQQKVEPAVALLEQVNHQWDDAFGSPLSSPSPSTSTS